MNPSLTITALAEHAMSAVPAAGLEQQPAPVGAGEDANAGAAQSPPLAA